MNMTSMFEDDAGALQVRDDQLSGISELAKRAKTLEKEIEDQEAVLKDMQNKYRKLIEETLPEALTSMGMKKFVMEDGSSIDVKPFYSASIPSDKKEEAFKWLRENGFDDIIKNTVAVRFGRKEDELAAAVVSQLQSQGLTVEQAAKIEPMTLKAWVREQIEKGNPIDSELFGIHIGQKAVIKSV